MMVHRIGGLSPPALLVSVLWVGIAGWTGAHTATCENLYIPSIDYNRANVRFVGNFVIEWFINIPGSSWKSISSDAAEHRSS